MLTLLYLLPLLTLYIPRAVLGQVCTGSTSPTSQYVNLFTGSTGVTIGGAASSTLNIAPVTFPTTNTINIGGTGSTVNIGSFPPSTPSPAPSYSTVSINGVPSISWGAWQGATPAPALTVENGADKCCSLSFPPTNLNPRAGTPSPMPSTTPYLTACSPTFTTSIPGFLQTPFTGVSDCIILPLAGYWSISASISMQIDGPANWLTASLVPSATPNPTPIGNQQNYMVSNHWNARASPIAVPSLSPTPWTVYVSEQVTVPTTSSTPIAANSYYFCIGASGTLNTVMVKPNTNGRYQSLLVKYLGPL